MTGAWPFFAVGLLLLCIVIFFLWRSKVQAHDRSEPSSSDDLPDANPAEFFPQELAARLFGLDDWKFIDQQGSPGLRRMFLQQRTALALSLLRIVRANASMLVRAHSRAARENAQLKPGVELKVIADYLLLQMLCQVLALLIWLRGPVDLLRLVGYADDLSRRLKELTMGIIAAGLTTGEKHRL